MRKWTGRLWRDIDIFAITIRQLYILINFLTLIFIAARKYVLHSVQYVYSRKLANFLRQMWTRKLSYMVNIHGGIVPATDFRETATRSSDIYISANQQITMDSSADWLLRTSCILICTISVVVIGSNLYSLYKEYSVRSRRRSRCVFTALMTIKLLANQ